jgi:RsiW-degrading membrane proteinase PrsW (M82 family)
MHLFTRTWRAKLMMAVVRILLLICGAIILMFGGLMYVENLDFLQGCPGDTFGFWGESPIHEENCRVAAGNVIFGLLFAIIGMILILLGAISLWSAGWNRMKAMQTCPHCSTTINWRSSRRNCANCGSPIDW